MIDRIVNGCDKLNFRYVLHTLPYVYEFISVFLSAIASPMFMLNIQFIGSVKPSTSITALD